MWALWFHGNILEGPEAFVCYVYIYKPYTISGLKFDVNFQEQWWTVRIAQSTCTSISSAVKMKFTICQPDLQLQFCFPSLFQIVATVLLGLLLAPALANTVFQNNDYQLQDSNTRQITVTGGYQIVTVNRSWRVAIIEQRSTQGTWKTVWNYNNGFIATKVPSEGICFVSTMNRSAMPTLESLLTSVSLNVKGQGVPSREITFLIRGVVHDLQSYGSEVFAMCRGSTTYLAYEVYGPQYTSYNQGSCDRLDVLHLLELNYCRANNKI
ncbi:gastrokine-1 [Porphyrio hochstetteri]